MRMIRHERFAYVDACGRAYDMIQTWAQIPATQTWIIVAVQPVTIDGNRVGG